MRQKSSSFFEWINQRSTSEGTIDAEVGGNKRCGVLVVLIHPETNQQMINYNSRVCSTDDTSSFNKNIGGVICAGRK